MARQRAPPAELSRTAPLTAREPWQSSPRVGGGEQATSVVGSPRRPSSARSAARPSSARGAAKPRPPLADYTDQATTARFHRLLTQQAAQLQERPRDLHRSGDVPARLGAEDYAERCLLSLALWRRVGTAEFAESLGWLPRTDYAAMSAALSSGAAEAAVRVWRSGRHAAGERTVAQRNVRAVELRAWELGHGAAGDARESALDLRELEHRVLLRRGGGRAADAELARQRASCAHAAGEALVRGAYQRLLTATHHPLWDLWRKRQFVVAAMLKSGGLESVREALLQVRGYGGPHPDAECEGWGLAFDLATATPLSEDRGPIEWCGAYVAWLRKREVQRRAPTAAAHVSRTPPSLARRRPAAPVAVDLIGLA